MYLYVYTYIYIYLVSIYIYVCVVHGVQGIALQISIIGHAWVMCS